jgi:hypothetical protein
MIEAGIVTVLIGGLVAVPLGWGIWHDRARDRALGVQAEVHTAVRRALGGESLLSIDVVPPLLGRRGRVILHAPGHWEWMVEAVVKDVLERMPDGYDLVVPSTAHGRPLAPPAPVRAAA